MAGSRKRRAGDCLGLSLQRLQSGICPETQTIEFVKYCLGFPTYPSLHVDYFWPVGYEPKWCVTSGMKHLRAIVGFFNSFSLCHVTTVPHGRTIKFIFVVIYGVFVLFCFVLRTWSWSHWKGATLRSSWSPRWLCAGRRRVQLYVLSLEIWSLFPQHNPAYLYRCPQEGEHFRTKSSNGGGSVELFSRSYFAEMYYNSN